MYKTLKIRIKDKHSKFLLSLSKEVNFVWNYINELSYEHIRRKGKFLSSYEISKFTTGSTKGKLGKDGLNILAQSIQAINDEYVSCRNQTKRIKLSWRRSNKDSSKYSLGWIPFPFQAIKIVNGQIRYGSHFLSMWDSYGLSQYKDKIKSGCFSEDSRGRWYVCLAIKIHDKDTQEKVQLRTQSIKSHISSLSLEEVKAHPKYVGIDPGLKTFATLSNGKKFDTKKNYRDFEEKLGKAQRAGKTDRVRAIHAKIKNKRNDELHKLSTQLVRDYEGIFIGDVNSSKLAKTWLAKSVLDKGWSMFRNMLEYKCEHAGMFYQKTNESFTTQTCSHCGSMSNSPKGRADLGIRVWSCNCGATLDRDVNSATNILAVGHGRLVEGISCCQKQE